MGMLNALPILTVMLRSFPRKNKKRSPLTAKPLRNSRQSLDEAIHRLMDEDASMIIFTAAACFVFTGYEWWRWSVDVPPHPVLITVFCSLLFTYCGFRFLALRQKVKTLKMARDGERAVGHYLDRLRENGYRVFHDVVGKNFNIDHVVVGNKGIFTIETKNYSKPLRGKSSIHFDGESITVNGCKTDRNPVIQALAQAGWLSAHIQETTGHTHKVQPVIVFPGWSVTSRIDSERQSGVWVINPRGLTEYIDNAPHRLASEEINLVSYHLSRYIRAHNQSDY